MNRELITVGLICMLCIIAVSASTAAGEGNACHRPCCRENFSSGLDPAAVLR